MYCGGCFRDNAMVGALRAQGHSVLMVPLYLPMTLDEPSQTQGTKTFFTGINVYLEQQSAFFRHAPKWLHNLLASPKLLKMAGKHAGKTRPEDVGALTISMLRGEDGNQARELDELIAFLKTQPKFDAISLSYVLLAGLVRRLRKELNAPVICSLQGEDYFLDALSPEFRDKAWETVIERVRDVDGFIAPTQYFADLMQRRLKLPLEKVRVVHNGIQLNGFQPAAALPQPPVLGYFARMCEDKGLGLAVDTFIVLKRRGNFPQLKFKVGGGCGPSDEKYVAIQKEKLSQAGVLNDVSFHPNLTREEKLEFFHTLTVFSTPAMYGEAFGLYVIEALAAGVPVVQPRHAGFPELVELTGGGLVTDPNAQALATGIESLLADPAKAQAFGRAGRANVEEKFAADRMAREVAEAYQQAIARFTARSPAQPVIA